MAYNEPLTGAIVQIIDEADPRQSDTTLLVAALLTLGIPRATHEFFHFTCEHTRGEVQWRAFWSLRDVSPCGRFSTRKLQAAWNDGTWLVRNPAHPLSIIRGGLTLKGACAHAPRFTLEELARIETPDTWIECAMRNLIILLRDMPLAAKAARRIVHFGPRWTAGVPLCMPEPQKKHLLNYVENPSKRPQLASKL